MDWKAVGKAIMGFAPAIGGALLGPPGAAAGAAVSALARSLGEDEAEITPTKVLTRLQEQPEDTTARITLADLESTAPCAWRLSRSIGRSILGAPGVGSCGPWRSWGFTLFCRLREKRCPRFPNGSGWAGRPSWACPHGIGAERNVSRQEMSKACSKGLSRRYADDVSPSSQGLQTWRVAPRPQR
ncbi:MAG: hypothetical protein JRJ69_16665 [Deltaproteobacteria bacterium]|nr:hypothetical protein [Deltaproteobacteria bacterium]